ncbi:MULTISPECIES: GntR family transcriptional regulator [Flavobacteriaceae]|uniref:GntR family transcriptional regulator n=1 Tax=Flavobacteriaceae TaxID=49546 RepID=UPI001490ADEA|nr:MULTISPECIES: GntR family transcriptional regulator [Allomuricauda]MDC6364673.1 GntR family transcriptional regulator [Muricauda sp. AC10]
MNRISILRNKVRDHLLDQMQQGELSIGETVNLAKLSRNIGVSVTPIREALSQLEHAQVLKAIPNRGFVVAELSQKEAKNLYETIAQLEIMALESSSFTDEDSALLKSILRKTQFPNPALSRLRLRFQFHESLVKNCKNTVLLQILDNLKMRLLFYEHGLVEDMSFYQLMDNQNEAIVQAIEENNIPTATLILKMNWMTVLEYVEKRI